MKRLLTIAAVAALAACSREPNFDDTTQIGPNPVLPKPQQFLVPPIGVSKPQGWSNGRTPHVPAGFQIKALATGLANPRFLYTLPNGDILAVQAEPPSGEPIKRPKDIIFGMVLGSVHNYPGGRPPKSRITLIRDANGDGVPEIQQTLLDNLNAPFGVSLGRWHACTSPIRTASSLIPSRRARRR